MRRFIKWIFILGLLGATIAGYFLYDMIYAPNTNDSFSSPHYVFIKSGSSLRDVTSAVLPLLKSEKGFERLCSRMNLTDQTVKAGRFEFQSDMSNYQIIDMLRDGRQMPVRFTLQNKRTIKDICKLVSKHLEVDSSDLQQLLTSDDNLLSVGMKKEEVMSLFLPNTYEFLWNTSAKGFLSRMKKEHKNFWTETRIKQANTQNLSVNEVYTMASIVDGETNQTREMPTIAGVYLNRLRDDWRLQADPTVVFAVGDFTLRRVLKRHLKVDSPYNTYKYYGLPPGPIRMASHAAIKAVLNAEKHEYMFFCARGDGTGFHNFAETIKGHGNNIAIYKRNLKRRGRR